MRGSSRNGSMDNLSSGPGSPAHGASNGGSQHSNVYVKNLSEDVDELTLKGVFDKFGAVESCCVIRDVSTNSSRGFGFVKFVQVHQAEAAIKEMNGKVIRGKVLEVKFANSDSSATTAASGVGTISDNIYVKGLPPLWTEVELRAFFKIFGTIIECRLLHASGTTTAGALIRFSSMEQAASAVVTANGRVPAGGQVPLVIRFADSHSKTRRSSKSERNLAALPGGGSAVGGSGHGMNGLGGSISNGLVDIPGAGGGGGAGSRDSSFRGGSQHHPGVVSPGTALISLMANNAAAAGGSAHGSLDIASMLLARQNAVAAAALLQQQQQQQMAATGDGSFRSGSFHVGSVDSASSYGDDSFRRGSHSPYISNGGLGGGVNGGNASGFGGALNALQQQQKQQQQQQQQQRGGGGGVDGGVNGVGGLSAMFAGGMDIAGAPSLATGPSTQGITFGTGAPATSALDKSSRGSSVRGGNAFGPGSFASASASSLPNVVSPVGSYDKDGLWSAMGGRAAAGGGGGGGPGTTSSSDPLDRAETPGISAAEAAHLLDSLEDAEDDVAAFVPFGGGRGSGVVDRSGPSIADRPRALAVSGLPAGADELWVYKNFALHGAVLEVVLEEGGGEATVKFAKGGDAAVAMRSMDGRDALSVVDAEAKSPAAN
mmetsp:Transcript_11944/g.51426  ORF Transcript_11944/g.51426 Transcript_11944/m.51426 type:complete len:657 (+) Transcript_11944:436-2406(+)